MICFGNIREILKNTSWGGFITFFVILFLSNFGIWCLWPVAEAIFIDNVSCMCRFFFVFNVVKDFFGSEVSIRIFPPKKFGFISIS